MATKAIEACKKILENLNNPCHARSGLPKITWTPEEVQAQLEKEHARFSHCFSLSCWEGYGHENAKIPEWEASLGNKLHEHYPSVSDLQLKPTNWEALNRGKDCTVDPFREPVFMFCKDKASELPEEIYTASDARVIDLLVLASISRSKLV